MKIITHEEFKPTVKKTDEKLFSMLIILKDEHDNKYVLISYQEEYYLDNEQMKSMTHIADDSMEYTIDGASYGTLYDLGYNI